MLAIAASLACDVSIAADDGAPRIVYYDVTGNSARELRAQLDTLGPPDDRNGRRFDGYTDTQVRWTYRFENTRAGCVLRSFDVTLATTMMLPRWNASGKAKASLRADWDRYVAALRLHEDGHHANGLRSVDAVQEAFQARLDDGAPSPDCAALQEDLNALGKTVVMAGNRLDLEYDAATRHGATQGVRL